MTFGDFVVGEKDKDKYLGDWFSSKGQEESVYATIKSREGMVRTAIMEVAAIVNDYRMQAVGGIMAAFDL